MTQHGDKAIIISATSTKDIMVVQCRRHISSAVNLIVPTGFQSHYTRDDRQITLQIRDIRIVGCHILISSIFNIIGVVVESVLHHMGDTESCANGADNQGIAIAQREECITYRIDGRSIIKYSIIIVLV